MSEATRGPASASWFRRLGPGLITGAADDDPGGIATHSQVGAQFGLNLMWTVALTYPLMTAIQSICARIGRVTGEGLAANMARVLPRWLVSVIVLLLFVANTVNIGADLAAMGAAAQLVLGWGETPVRDPVRGRFAPPAGLRALSPLCACAEMADAEPARLCRRRLHRGHRLGRRGARYSVAADRLVAGRADRDRRRVRHDDQPLLCSSGKAPKKWKTRRWPATARCSIIPQDAPAELDRIAWDTYIGMGFSSVISFFIVLTTAVTLHTAGITDIATSAQAAQALRPIAGEFAFLLFSLGIIGTGLLALPVLAGSAAYAVGELRGWRIGLEQKPRNAKAFYGVIALAFGLGLLMLFLPIDPIKAAVLERGAERRDRRAADGGDHDRRVEPQAPRPVRRAARAQDRGLAGDGGDGGGGARDVRSVKHGMGVRRPGLRLRAEYRNWSEAHV